MINELCTAKKGTPHVVRAVNVVREMTKELELFLEEYKTLTEANKKQPKMKTNIKMRVTPEQSAKVQEIIFKNGGSWTDGDTNIETINHPFLYLKENSLLTHSMDCNYFKSSSLCEVDPELFIRTNGTCEEDNLCGADELKTIKDVLQDIEAPQKDDGAYDFNDFDQINPTHYQIGGIETIDFIEAKLTQEEFKGYCKGNAIKYLSRAGHKGNEVEDYEKAAWYLDRLLEIVQKRANNG